MELDNFVFKVDEEKEYPLRGETISCNEVRCNTDGKAEDIVGLLYKIVFLLNDVVTGEVVGGAKVAEALIKRFIDTPAKEIVVFEEGE